MTQRLRGDSGFTLIELMMVLAILSILATMAMVSHRHVVEKARSVEAEVALAEINRLETLYYANHGTYSSDFTVIGFTLSPMLKHHKVLVRLQDGGTSFQAIAVPFADTLPQQALVLTSLKEGTTLRRIDSVTAVGLGGGSPGSSSTSSFSDQGVGGNPTKPHCKDGGEATVAQDGLLDMNFCLK
ncbi:MAG: prepilin-type N-terminal cleavage/methylation domain-containing protein [Nitrospirota bacterium]|jgi:prepilin-type N-terminal cleavage/methylation domain-containing protein